MRGQRNQHVGSMMAGATPSAQRASLLALLCTLRQLRLSVFKHRPITLPNLLRLFLRHHSRVLPAERKPPASELCWLESSYRREHPFTMTNWRQWRREL